LTFAFISGCAPLRYLKLQRRVSLKPFDIYTEPGSEKYCCTNKKKVIKYKWNKKGIV
jgi:hypothetical protein